MLLTTLVYAKSGGISFQLEKGRSVAVFDTGKVLMSTMKKVNEPNAYGRTQHLSTFTSESLSLKFKLVHFNSERIQFGLGYKYINTQPVVKIFCKINKSTSFITCEKDGTKILSKDLKLLVNLDDVNAEYCVEVSRKSRTIRFLLNGEQLHYGDIPIPLSMEQLNNSWFSVCLFAPGDCVRICDWGTSMWSNSLLSPSELFLATCICWHVLHITLYKLYIFRSLLQLKWSSISCIRVNLHAEKIRFHVTNYKFLTIVHIRATGIGFSHILK